MDNNISNKNNDNNKYLESLFNDLQIEEKLKSLFDYSIKVYNPNFIEDLEKYLNTGLDANQLEDKLTNIREKSPTTYEKIETLVDRIEFIEHLSILKNNAKNSKYILDGHEVIGIDNDIESLRLYLSLTCIDILSSNFETFDKWLIKNCDDYDTTNIISFKEYIKNKSEDYQAEFKLSSNFSKAFHNASTELNDKLLENLKVNGSKNSDLGTIVQYFYRIRNKYTHEGRRFHVRESSNNLNQNQTIGPRDKDSLSIKNGFDLVESLLLVAKEQAQRIILK